MAEARPDAAGVSRILTLVFTDLADSTALKTQQGDQRVGELIARHRALVSTLASASAGRVIDWAGDGCFLTFETPSAAVGFALRLQQAHSEEPDLPGVRTGIHMGEVSEGSGPGGDGAPPRIEGLAVDLAARICGLARPAQVLMSSAVADSARQRLDVQGFSRPIAWRSYGGYSLKGFDKALEIAEAGLEGVASFAAPVASDKATARPADSSAGRSKLLRVSVVAVILGVAIAGASWWMKARQPDAAAPPTRKSVAVLPFVNMSSDKENEYFSDGITEDLITALSKVAGLHVAARTSSFAFKGKNEDIQQIGEQLYVGAVLEGSVAKAGERVRITAQLINVEDGYHLWSERYDRDLKDVFAIRSEVAQTVANALQVTLAAGEREGIEQKPTEDLEAYQLYLKARYAIEGLTSAGVKDAIGYLREAVARDPNYALAHLGMAYYYMNVTDGWMPANESMPLSRDAAETALRLDPSLAEAHTWLGVVHWWYDRDTEAARREFQTALAMQPNLSSAREWYSLFLLASGHTEEGLAESRRAVALDPLSPEANTWLGANLYFARRYEEAIEVLRATSLRNPDLPYTRLWLSRAYARTGRFEQAIAVLSPLEMEDLVGAESKSALGRAHADAGNTEEATRALNHLRERMRDDYVSASFLAAVQLGLDDTDGALASLAQAATEHSYYVPWWKVDPELDPLRSDPRFTALLKPVRLD
jgi:TolB-like protein/class 3 adenylate cyclase/Flp pilus assembly protein TadD